MNTQRRSFLQVLVYVGVVFIVSIKLVTFAACDSSKQGQCGAAGGCAEGALCTNNGRNPYCKVDTSCGGTPCSPAGKCGGSGGSSCAEGFLCTGPGTCIVATTSCSTIGATNDCSALGCDHGCGVGRKCVNTGYGLHCLDDDACGSDTTGNDCTSLGCDHGCGVGRKCVQTGYGLKCQDASECSVPTCKGSGCGGDCGPGTACTNGVCVPNPACAATAINVPYTGPRITNLGGLLARFYNLLFPGVLLYGFIMIIKAGYVIMTSQGDPRVVQSGQEDLSAAVIGTLFAVLAVGILRVIITRILGGSVGF